MHLPPEIESGNIEYKLKIIPENKARLVRLSTQLRWRCNEGRGMSIYFIGITDLGEIVGIQASEFNVSLENLVKMVNLNKSMILQKTINQLQNGKFWATVFILSRNLNENNLQTITYTFQNKIDDL